MSASILNYADVVFNSLHVGLFFMSFLLSANFFFKITFFKKFFQSVKLFGSRSGPTFCRSWPRSKLYAKVNSKPQVAASKEFNS